MNKKDFRPKIKVCIRLPAGLENCTRPLIFTSTKGFRASEYFDIPSENEIFPIYANNFCDAGQVPIFKYFEACYPKSPSSPTPSQYFLNVVGDIKAVWLHCFPIFYIKIKIFSYFKISCIMKHIFLCLALKMKSL